MVISMEGYCVQYKAVLRVEQAAPRSTLPPSSSFSTQWLMKIGPGDDAGGQETAGELTKLKKALVPKVKGLRLQT